MGFTDPFLNMLDHQYLNEVEGLENPTTVNLAIWIWERVKLLSSPASRPSPSGRPAPRGATAPGFHVVRYSSGSSPR